jgi:6-phosphogluconolactonase (cycloisomerase 2 family)
LSVKHSAIMRRLLISGDRANFTTLEFDTTNSELRILADYAAPCNASWTERSCSQGGVDHLIGISEDEKSALVYTFQIDHDQQSCKITSQQETSAGPCHCKFSLPCFVCCYSRL